MPSASNPTAVSPVRPPIRDSAAAAAPERLFYDGHCALCHGSVKFILARDRDGSKFRFAPLQGATFASLQAAAFISRPGVSTTGNGSAPMPETILLRTDRGELLARSDAAIHILRRLGGFWGFVGGALAVLPRAIRDAMYKFVARIRYRVFGKREDLCPVMPPEWRSRFDD